MSNEDYVNLKVRQKIKIVFFFKFDFFYFAMVLAKSRGTAYSLNNNFSPSVVLSFYLIYIKLWQNYFRSVIGLLAKLNHCGT